MVGQEVVLGAQTMAQLYYYYFPTKAETNL